MIKGKRELKNMKLGQKCSTFKNKGRRMGTAVTTEFCSETVGKCHGNVPRLACHAYHRAVMRVKLFEILALRPRTPVHPRSVQLQRETIYEFRNLCTHKPFQPRFKGP